MPTPLSNVPPRSRRIVEVRYAAGDVDAHRGEAVPGGLGSVGDEEHVPRISPSTPPRKPPGDHVAATHPESRAMRRQPCAPRTERIVNLVAASPAERVVMDSDAM